MRAMIFEEAGAPLRERDVAPPEPGGGEMLLDVRTCAVCRTDLHIVDGELPDPKLPLIPGHQIVATVSRCGPGVTRFREGQRVGVPWLGRTCGRCRYCRTGRENLCEEARFTGYDLDGGYAERTVAHQDFAFPIPDGIGDVQAAPLLCGGLIGYRAWRMMRDDVRRVGFYGFGSAAHMLVQVARHEGRDVYAFTRPGDEEGQAFAREMGAVWAGGADEPPPEELDAAIIFAPVGPLMTEALRHTARGGSVISAGIHMSDIPSFPYSMLWGERIMRSVANLTRRDGEEFMALAPEIPVETEVTTYPLEQAGQALDDLREGRFTGSAVLIVDPSRVR
ncbi:MAG: zinc-dependent alcohol dehydrogenase family protein [Myxococcota bacterium]